MSDRVHLSDYRRLLIVARECEESGSRAQARAAYSLAADADPLGRVELAGYLARSGELDASRREWIRVRSEAAEAGDVALEVTACRNLASICRELHCFAEAHCWQQRAVSVLMDSAESATLEAQDLIARASDAFLQGEFDLAEQLLCRVIEATRSAGDVESQGDAWGTLGLVFGRKGLLGASVRCLRRAAVLHHDCGDLRGTAADYLNLAEVFRLEGRLAASRTCLKRATRAAVQSRDPLRWSTATRRMREIQRIESVRRQRVDLN